MKKRFPKPALQALLVLIVYLPFLAATSVDKITGPVPEFSGRINDFAFDLLKRETAAGGSNGMVSPFSIFSNLAMGYVASGGDTRRGLAQALHFPADNDSLIRDLAGLRRKMWDDGNRPGSELRMADAIWLDTTWAEFRPEYLRTLGRMGAEPPRNTKFAEKEKACADINAWIARATNGRITQGIVPADIKSRSHFERGYINEPALVAVDAAWFKAGWMHCFDSAGTSQRMFNTPGGGGRDVPMMHQNALFLYAQSPQYQLLDMPYLGGRYSMIVLLPRETAAAGAITAPLTAQTVTDLMKWLHPATVDILFPKFTIKYHSDLNDSLIALGAATAFDDEHANFDAMIIKHPQAYRIYLSSVKEDTWMQVSEEGTEAAAATTAVYYSVGCSEAPGAERVDFHADHPFLFFIVHNPSRAILFAGWISDPAKLATDD